MRLRYRLILTVLMLALIPLILINIQANLALTRLSKQGNDETGLVLDNARNSTSAISGEALTKMLSEVQENYDKGIRSAQISLIFSGSLLELIILGMGIWVAVTYASLVERIAGTASRTLKTVQSFTTDIGTGPKEPAPLEGIVIDNRPNPREMEKQPYQTLKILETSIQEKLIDLKEQVKSREDGINLISEKITDLKNIVHEAAEAHEISQLLNKSAEKIFQEYGYSYVGIFLTDKTGEYIELKAEAGGNASNQDGVDREQSRLEMAFRLKVSESTKHRDGEIPGYVAATGEVYQTADLSKDVLFQPEPGLSAPRSEIALPLRIHGRVLGVLDIYSTRLEKFSTEDVALLSVIADHLALAVDNARIVEQSQQAQEVEQGLFSDVTRKAWLEMIRSRPDWGYRSEDQGIFSVEGEWHPWMVQAMQQGQVVVWQEGGYTIASIPIRVRDYILGVLDFRKAGESSVWTTDELALVQTLTDQLGQALESARLYQNTQYRAERERILADITSKVRASTNVNVILQTAVKELAEALRVPKGAIQLRSAGREAHERQAQSNGGGQLNG